MYGVAKGIVVPVIAILMLPAYLIGYLLHAIGGPKPAFWPPFTFHGDDTL